MTIEDGIYTITNVKSGTALDLSGGDNKSIIGFTVHGQGNQQVHHHLPLYIECDQALSMIY
jgi:hypothetical protein